jgi:superfamily II DNA/RNA helicase
LDKVSFEKYGLSDEVLRAIKNLGYKNPTEVQNKVLSNFSDNQDIIVKAQTGSGKTAAFGIPLCDKIEIEEKSPQVLVLTPTRELAIQVKDDISNIGRLKKIRVTAVYGKQPIHIQERNLKQRVHIIAGTPGRTFDHIVRKNIVLDKIKYLVIDEADKMLSMGFIDEVESIIKKLPKDRVTMLFSATMPEKIQRICTKYMKEPKTIEIESNTLTVEKIIQVYYEIEKENKFSLLNKIIYTENILSSIIFCNTREEVEYVGRSMGRKGFSADILHGGMEQRDRLEIMEKFKKGEFKYLVATDVAARGIHIDDLTHVINYEVPYEKESYVHRIGRTGRAGENGKAITFVTPFEYKFFNELMDYVNVPIEKIEKPSEDEFLKAKELNEQEIMAKPKLKKNKNSEVNKGISKIRINSGKKKKIRPGDILGAISNMEGITPEDIGIIDVQDTMSHVDILNNKGNIVAKQFQTTKIKGRTVSARLLR